jgi:N-acetylglucosaminyldiphosphoundecaprenol N-acetyl-beta-D-mannosaminyltransferase
MMDIANQAPRVMFLGCPLDLIGHDEILRRAEQALHGYGRLRIEGMNVAKLIDARCNPLLMTALNEAELVHADGAGISIGLKAMKISPPMRRAGIDLMIDICRLAVLSNQSIYLLGARPMVVRMAAQRLTDQVPGLRIAGMRDGYFSVNEGHEVAAAIRRSGAGVLFIGISSPKKEVFLQANWEQLGVLLAMGVGGSFDVVSGALRRAPLWMQRNGLEWLYRMKQEPMRLIGRYMRTNLGFLWLLARARLRGGELRIRRGT